MEIVSKFSSIKKNSSYFISFEGIEGAGKSTQIVKLKELINRSGFDCVVLREPGASEFGELIRAAILNSKKRIAPLAEAYAFAAARAQLLEKNILPLLEKLKTVVICDRYLDSSLVYQGIGRDLGIETILNIHSHYPLTIVPNRTFYLKISIETSNLRQIKRDERRDYFESETRDFFLKLIEGYEMVTNLFPQRIAVIDADKGEDEVFSDIEQEWQELISC